MMENVILKNFLDVEKKPNINYQLLIFLLGQTFIGGIVLFLHLTISLIDILQFVLLISAIIWCIYPLYLVHVRMTKSMDVYLTEKEIVRPEFEVRYIKRRIPYSNIRAIYLSDQSDNSDLFKRYRKYGIYDHGGDISFEEWREGWGVENSVIIDFINHKKETEFWFLDKYNFRDFEKFKNVIVKKVKQIIE